MWRDSCMNKRCYKILIFVLSHILLNSKAEQFTIPHFPSTTLFHFDSETLKRCFIVGHSSFLKGILQYRAFSSNPSSRICYVPPSINPCTIPHNHIPCVGVLSCPVDMFTKTPLQILIIIKKYNQSNQHMLLFNQKQSLLSVFFIGRLYCINITKIILIFSIVFNFFVLVSSSGFPFLPPIIVFQFFIFL